MDPNTNFAHLIEKDSHKQWFILRGEMKYGPYDYSSIIRMMQDHEVLDYNYLWSEHLDAWTLLSELPEFSKDRLAILVQDKNFMDEAFNRRKQTRAPIVAPILAHNDKHLFDGQTLNLSAGGGLFLLNDPLLLPRDQILIYFRKTPKSSEDFKVLAEIVRKNYSRQRLNVKSGLYYALRFLKVQEPGHEIIRQWVEKKN